MGKFQRVFVIVLDSLGFGAMPDAEQYGDSNVDTIGHIAEKMQLHIPNLQKLGAANIRPINGVASVTEPLAKVTKLCEKSHGKDTMTGHWEMMGLYITKPFKTFTDTGFPSELSQNLRNRPDERSLGIRAASGTVILDELGEEEINEGHLIVYTSADSVLQICGNEETMGDLTRYTIIARSQENLRCVMNGRWGVSSQDHTLAKSVGSLCVLLIATTMR